MEIEEQVDRFAAAGEFAMSFLSKEDRLAIARYNLALTMLVQQYGDLSPDDPLSDWVIDTATNKVPGAKEVLAKKSALQIKIFDSGNG